VKYRFIRARMHSFVYGSSPDVHKVIHFFIRWVLATDAHDILYRYTVVGYTAWAHDVANVCL